MSKKTNAMRILDSLNIAYKSITYSSKDGKIDGVSVARKTGQPLEKVYKTLVAQGNSGELYIFVIPVAEELDLKKAAKAVGEKRIEMIAVKDIRKYTGYVQGACSPIGMKREYTTLIDETMGKLDKIIISGGRLGVQIELKADELKNITRARIYELKK